MSIRSSLYIRGPFDLPDTKNSGPPTKIVQPSYLLTKFRDDPICCFTKYSDLRFGVHWC